MTVFRRLSFWLPVLAVMLYVNELWMNPAKDIVFAVDPLLAQIVGVLNHRDYLYDHDRLQMLFPGFLVHVILWFLYGLFIDYAIHILFKQEEKED
ncbi:hypothetical protein NCCP2716_27030 [Sporosarcina sp. NCCP-2716]|uniref:hypothetical protein n=1 Tax=Sporosarcina sp. NCCP-2716 TaxID=2943679 RepID=UPI00203BC4C9|nr:hypothetical protein [Sporosarcina sp. NCCP-2716]GKV70205.1 hypothetical protein NCCP2716_27030 [Sporosarcina sp. NCCP-2716]